MEMRLPGGTSVLDALVGAGPTGFGSGHAVVQDPTVDQLQDALAGLRAGHVEFVILCDDDGTFQQVAGERDGPYLLERRSTDEAWPPFRPAGPVGFDQVHRAMHAYLAHHRDLDGVEWVQESPEPRKGRLRRFFTG